MQTSGSHSSSVTTITLAADADALGVGTILRVENEKMRFRGYGRVNAGGRSLRKLNVDRGVHGTTAASHATAKTVSVVSRDYDPGDAIADPTFTGTATIEDVDVSGDATFAGGMNVAGLPATAGAEGDLYVDGGVVKVSPAPGP